MRVDLLSLYRQSSWRRKATLVESLGMIIKDELVASPGQVGLHHDAALRDIQAHRFHWLNAGGHCDPVVIIVGLLPHLVLHLGVWALGLLVHFVEK